MGKLKKVRALKFAFLLLVCISLIGCMGSPEVVEQPPMDAEAMADGAMELCDADDDGFITKSEAKACPSIKSAMIDLDIDPKDNKISRDEMLARFNLYVESKIGLTAPSIRVVKGSQNGIGLVGATVKMIPESFMEDYIEPAEGTVIDPETGYTNISAVAGMPGVRIGFYRIEITSDDMKVPAKFNEKSIYGVEIPPVTSKAAEMIFVVK